VFLVLAVALSVATIGLVREARPAAADHIQIIVSLSNSEPTPAAQPLSLYPGGPPITIYIWAKDAHDPTGIAAFNIGFPYDSARLTVNSVQLETSWLGSTGRIVLCAPPFIDPNPETGDGRVVAGCSTIGSPVGAQGTGLLASVTFQPGTGSGFTTLAFAPDTFLINRGSRTGGVTPPAMVPGTAPGIVALIANCADFNADGSVSVFDMLNVARRFGARPGMATWHAMFDLNANGLVDMQDILLAGRQFGRRCRI
jgi:hypothetical protein